MTREQIIAHIFASADCISDIVDNYDEEYIDLFRMAPPDVLQRMAAVLSDAHRHLEQNLGAYQAEFDKIAQQKEYEDD